MEKLVRRGRRAALCSCRHGAGTDGGLRELLPDNLVWFCLFGGELDENQAVVKTKGWRRLSVAREL